MGVELARSTRVLFFFVVVFFLFFVVFFMFSQKAHFLHRLSWEQLCEPNFMSFCIKNNIGTQGEVKYL